MKKTRFVLFAALVAAIAVAFTGCANGVDDVRSGLYVPAKVIYTEGDEEVIDIVDWTAKTCTTNGVPCDFYETYEYWETAYKVEGRTAYMATAAVTNAEFEELGYLAYDEWGDSPYDVKTDGNDILLQTGSGFLIITWKTFYPSDDPNYDYYTLYEHEATTSSAAYTKKTYYKIF